MTAHNEALEAVTAEFDRFNAEVERYKETLVNTRRVCTDRQYKIEKLQRESAEQDEAILQLQRRAYRAERKVSIEVGPSAQAIEIDRLNDQLSVMRGVSNTVAAESARRAETINDLRDTCKERYHKIEQREAKILDLQEVVSDLQAKVELGRTGEVNRLHDDRRRLQHTCVERHDEIQRLRAEVKLHKGTAAIALSEPRRRASRPYLAALRGFRL